MKKTLALVCALLVSVVLFGCGQKAPNPPFTADSEQYKFFKTLSDSLGLTILNPDKPTALITTSDFNVWTFDIMPGVYSRYSRYKSDLSRIPKEQLTKFMQQGANGEAEKLLLAAQAEKEGVAVSDSAVDAQLQRYYTSRGGEENFVKFIEQQGFTMDYVKKDVRMQMNIQEYVNNYLEKQIEISDAELQAAYDADKTATVRHILFLTQGKSEAEKAEAKKKAEDVLAQAKSGADFAQLAMQYTEDPGSKQNGGLYEDFPKGRMAKEFEDAAFNLPIDSISDLVETTYGYHIIKVIERKKETLPLDQVKDQLTNQLKQSKRRDTYDSMMNDLKAKTKYAEHFEAIG